MINQCVKKCRIEPDGTCGGCHRTLKQIEEYGKLVLSNRTDPIKKDAKKDAKKDWLWLDNHT